MIVISILKPIEDALLVSLKFFHQLTGDYGLAIILLTVAIRVLILPLTIQQTRSMQQMKKLQPKLKALQEKYKNDKQKLQEEIIKFYSEHKVNPLGGCLPLLLQLPILIGLFRVLTSQARAGQTFLFFLPDLSVSLSKLTLVKFTLYQAGAYYLLIALLLVTTYIPSKMMSTDPQQDKMMLFMSLFMLFIGWGLPAGVILYLVVSNLWTIGQQYIAQRAEGKG